MPERATLVASLTRQVEGRDLEALAGIADVLEVRADLTGPTDAAALRAAFPGRLLFTLRSETEGGAFTAVGAERIERLVAAASDYDLIDLEFERDLEPEILAAIPAERRVISWHGPGERSWQLRQRLDRMSEVPACRYKLIPRARRAVDGMSPMVFLDRLDRRDVVAFASGDAATWTRSVAPRLGSDWVFGSVGADGAAPGQPTLRSLVRDFGLPAVASASRLNGVIGAPVAHSLSPRLHNGLYRRLGIDALYVPLHVEEFGRFWLDFVEEEPTAAIGLPLGGFSVTAPHKRIALAVAGASSPLAARIGAANTLVRRRGVWEAEATDAEGVVGPLEELGVDLHGASAAVVGAGGGGCSAAAGLGFAGARVVLFNRTVERARRAGSRLGLAWAATGDLDVSRFDIVVNATPLGRAEGDPLPFDVDRLADGAVVVDMVYRRPAETSLASAARRRGLTVVDGREILLFQAGRQFRMMTGKEFPLEEARQLLEA